MGGFAPPKFVAPEANSIYSDPSYQFRLDQGKGALERSAAARGVLRTGGTLKDILEHGQNFASQEYGNIYNRALQSHDRAYQSELDRSRQAWDEYMFSNQPRGGGGGRGQEEFLPPPPEAPEYGPPEGYGMGEPDPYAYDPMQDKRNQYQNDYQGGQYY